MDETAEIPLGPAAGEEENSGAAAGEGEEGSGWRGRLTSAKGKALEVHGVVKKKAQEKYRQVSVAAQPYIESGTAKLKKKYTEARESGAAQALGKRYTSASEYASEKITSVKATAGDKIQSAKDKVATAKKSLAALHEKAKGRYPQYFGGDRQGDVNIQAFRDALDRGFEAVEIAAGQKFQLPFRVDGGEKKLLRWEFFIWDFDIDFKLVQRTMAIGGAVEVDVQPSHKYSCKQSGKGSYCPQEAGTLVLVFDNYASWVRPKHIAYRARVSEQEDSGDADKPLAALSPTVGSKTATASPDSVDVGISAAASPSELSRTFGAEDSRTFGAEDESLLVPPSPQLNLPPPGRIVATPVSKQPLVPPRAAKKDIATPGPKQEDAESTGVAPALAAMSLAEPAAAAAPTTAASLPDPDDPEFWDKIGVGNVED